jgi:hypothetical protein
MDLKAYNEQHLIDIATAIRNLNKTNTKYRVKDMAGAITKMADTMVPSASVGVEYWAHISTDVGYDGPDYLYEPSSGTKVYGQNFITGIKSSATKTYSYYNRGYTWNFDIVNCPELKTIDLKDVNYSSEGYISLGLYNCPKLSKVILPKVTSSSKDTVCISNIVDCPNLKTLVIPGGTFIQTCNELMFSHIQKIYYRGKPDGNEFPYLLDDIKYGDTPISVFADMKYLTDIYVPWSQGAVLDANGNDVLETCPGLQAHGVTVHYNYSVPSNLE